MLGWGSEAIAVVRRAVLAATAAAAVLLFIAATADATTVMGSPTVGSMLTATPDAPGDTVGWYDCSPNGTLGTPVAAPAATATMSTYVVRDTDVGSYLCAQDSTSSPATVGVSSAAATDPASTAPTIGGTFQVGHTIAVTQSGTWTDTPSSAPYQWCRVQASGCVAISGATGSSYTLQPGDQGADVEVKQVPYYGTQPMTNLTTQSSADDTVAAASTIVPPTPHEISAPTISGSTVQGATLTASPGKWSVTPSSYDFQWQRCTTTCTNIPGATGGTYRLTDADVGTQLAVIVTAVDVDVPSSPVTSAQTAVVTGTTSTELLASPTSVGINQTVNLAAVVTSSADTADPDGTVTFENGGVAIPGCSSEMVTGPGQTVSVTCATSFGLSSPSLSATFTPSSGSPLSASASPTQAITVSPDHSVTTLDVPTTVKRRESVTYTATVMPADNLTGPVVPDGEVKFLDHGHAIRGCAAQTLQDGAATCTVRYRSSGTQRISARYGGSAGFGGSYARARTVHVVDVLPGAHGRRAAGSITATMQWTFHYTPSYTRVLALVLHGLPARSLVTVGCSGHGCPFGTRTDKVTRALKRMSIQGAFSRRRLRVRSKVVVTITRSRYVGEYYRFTIKSRHPPAVLISCLAPGSKRPGVGCKR